MKVIIDIPKDFTGDYIADKFKDFFSRVIADADCKGLLGRYEKEIAEMFLNAFDDSKEKNDCNCKHNSNPRDNDPYCRCDGKLTDADMIRNMSDEELTKWLKLSKLYKQSMEDMPDEIGVLPKDVYTAGYNKAIEDFKEAIDEEDREEPLVLDMFVIEEISDKLKK